MAQEFKVPVGTPRLTTTEIAALSSPQAGWWVFNTSSGKPQYYTGSAWTDAGSGGGHTIQDEGTSRTQRTNLNFIGDAVSATDDAGNDATKVTVSSSLLYREFYSAGIVKDNYTGSLTVIDLLATYVQDGKSLKVYVNGQLLTPAAHYNETTTSRVTLSEALSANDDIQVEWVKSSIGISIPSAGTMQREEYVAGTTKDNYSGSLTVIDTLASFANDGKTVELYINGMLQVPGIHYNETSTTRMTMADPLTSGARISLKWVGTALNQVSYTPATIVSEDFTASAGQTTFNTTNSMSGYAPLIFVDGILQRSGYSTPSPTQVLFADGLDAGQTVLVWFIKQTGNMGYMQEQTYEVLAIEGQQVFDLPWVFAQGGASLLVFCDGVKMSVGGNSSINDYFETTNKQVTFYTGRKSGMQMCFYAKNRLATGDADTVDGFHASYLLDQAVMAQLVGMFGG